MGWKMSVVARRTQPDENSTELVERLGYNASSSETVTLDRGLYPAPGVAISHWNGYLVLLSEEITETLLSDPAPKAQARHLLQILGPSKLLVGMLHSVTDLYGYAQYENGRLIRGRVGAADEGIIWQAGTPWNWEPAEEEFEGEQAVFTFFSEVFGAPLDTADDLLFETEFKRFRKAWKWSGLKRLFGR